MKLNETKQIEWLGDVVKAVNNKLDKKRSKMKIKKMSRVKRLPSNYYHNYNKPDVKKMYELMLASVDEE